MAIYFGNDKIKDIYYGSEPIEEVYYGSELVWRKKEYIQDGYWVHKDTGVKTYFGAGGIMRPPSWRYDCSEVQLPSEVTGLGQGCFRHCSALTSINIQEGVTTIGNYVFYGCSALSSITFPESVTSIGILCFYQCTSLILATVLPAIPPSLGDLAFNSVHTSFNIKVRSPYVNDYKTATNWISYASKISAI